MKLPSIFKAAGGKNAFLAATGLGTAGVTVLNLGSNSDHEDHLPQQPPSSTSETHNGDIKDWIASATGKASHIRHGLNAALYSAKTALQVSRENPNAQPTATALAEFLATLSSTSDIEDLHTSGVAEGGENGASRGRELKPAAGAGAGAGEVVQGQPHQQIQKRELGTGLAGTKLIDWLLEVAVTSGPSSPEADAMERYLLRVLRHADATSALLARPGNATRLLILTGRSPQLRKALDSLLSSSSSSMYGSISQIEYSTGLSVSSSSSVLPPIEVSVADAKEVVRLAGQRSQPPGQQLLTLRLLRYWADSSVLNCVRLASAGAGSVVADVASTSDDRTTRFTVVSIMDRLARDCGPSLHSRLRLQAWPYQLLCITADAAGTSDAALACASLAALSSALTAGVALQSDLAIQRVLPLLWQLAHGEGRKLWIWREQEQDLDSDHSLSQLRLLSEQKPSSSSNKGSSAAALRLTGQQQQQYAVHALRSAVAGVVAAISDINITSLDPDSGYIADNIRQKTATSSRDASVDPAKSRTSSSGSQSKNKSSGSQMFELPNEERRAWTEQLLQWLVETANEEEDRWTLSKKRNINWNYINNINNFQSGSSRSAVVDALCALSSPAGPAGMHVAHAWLAELIVQLSRKVQPYAAVKGVKKGGGQQQGAWWQRLWPTSTIPPTPQLPGTNSGSTSSSNNNNKTAIGGSLGSTTATDGETWGQWVWKYIPGTTSTTPPPLSNTDTGQQQQQQHQEAVIPQNKEVVEVEVEVEVQAEIDAVIAEELTSVGPPPGTPPPMDETLDKTLIPPVPTGFLNPEANSTSPIPRAAQEEVGGHTINDSSIGSQSSSSSWAKWLWPFGGGSNRDDDDDLYKGEESSGGVSSPRGVSDPELSMLMNAASVGPLFARSVAAELLEASGRVGMDSEPPPYAEDALSAAALSSYPLASAVVDFELADNAITQALKVVCALGSGGEGTRRWLVAAGLLPLLRRVALDHKRDVAEVFSSATTALLEAGSSDAVNGTEKEEDQPDVALSFLPIKDPLPLGIRRQAIRLLAILATDAGGAIEVLRLGWVPWLQDAAGSRDCKVSSSAARALLNIDSATCSSSNNNNSSSSESCCVGNTNNTYNSSPSALGVRCSPEPLLPIRQDSRAVHDLYDAIELARMKKEELVNKARNIMETIEADLPIDLPILSSSSTNPDTKNKNNQSSSSSSKDGSSSGPTNSKSSVGVEGYSQQEQEQEQRVVLHDGIHLFDPLAAHHAALARKGYDPRTAVLEDPVLDVVFIHGIRGGAFATWRREGSLALGQARDSIQREVCWPSAWLAPALPSVRLLSVEYAAPATGWEGESLPFAHTVTQIADRLAAAGVGDRPVVFVCHSMGGLIIKELLARGSIGLNSNVASGMGAAEKMKRQGQLQREGPDVTLNHFQRITKAATGVVFYSVPHFGARLADWGWQLRYVGAAPARAVAQLKTGPHLEDLNTAVRTLTKTNHLSVLSFSEGKPTQLAYLTAQIVPHESAYPGYGEFVVLDQHDHIAVCKPTSEKDPAYDRLFVFLKKRAEEAQERRRERRVASVLGGLGGGIAGIASDD